MVYSRREFIGSLRGRLAPDLGAVNGVYLEPFAGVKWFVSQASDNNPLAFEAPTLGRVTKIQDSRASTSNATRRP
jgi:hypothetical protein